VTTPTPEALALVAEAHPEDFCHRCGRPNPVWSAPNDLWNDVMGGPDGIVCPPCFAESAGPGFVWTFEPLRAALAEREALRTALTPEDALGPCDCGCHIGEWTPGCGPDGEPHPAHECGTADHPARLTEGTR
jgi:hypothetical protein